MTRNVSIEVEELKNTFPNIDVSYWREGGVDFFKLENFRVGDVNECVLQVGKFLGYESRLFFPKIMPTKHDRNWNHKNVLIGDKQYSAFSFRVPNSSLVNILLGHLGGLN